MSPPLCVLPPDTWTLNSKMLERPPALTCGPPLLILGPPQIQGG